MNLRPRKTRSTPRAPHVHQGKEDRHAEFADDEAEHEGREFTVHVDAAKAHDERFDCPGRHICFSICKSALARTMFPAYFDDTATGFDMFEDADDLLLILFCP